MAEERTLGSAPARDMAGESWSEEPSKEELQRRMEEARDSITNTVSEIKENVSHQVETVKDALDWREHFKKQPLAWSLGAAGVGFFAGYGLAAAFTGDARDDIHYASSQKYALAESPAPEAPNTMTKSNGREHSPGIFERLRETSAYERLSQEAGAIGDRLVEELSTTAQTIVLPALLNKIKGWIGLDLSDKTPSQAKKQETSAPYEPAFSRSSEL